MSAIESLPFFRSELVLVIAFLVLLVLDFVVSNKKWLACFALAAIGVAWLLSSSPTLPKELFFGYFTLDPFTHFFRTFAYVTIGLTLLISLAYERIPTKQQGEFYLLMLALAFLLPLMAASTNLLMIFIAIESVSLTSYLLVGFQKFDQRSSEASMKYMLFGAVSTALMLFGMSILFGATGSIMLSEIGAAISKDVLGIQPLALIGLVFMVAGIGFKISMVPFHMWAPDVYQGAPTPVTAFLTVAPKVLGFAVLARVLFLAFPGLTNSWTQLLTILAILTMTIGNVLAVSQFDIKRLLAYSSIAQAGYILVGLATPSMIGMEAVLIYAVAYLFTNLGAFFTVLAIERNIGSNDLGAYEGLSTRSPFLAISLTIFLLSLAGIPPLAGFIGKVYIFASAVQANAVALAVAIAINSAVAAYYYFKVVRAMYLRSAQSEAPITNPFPVKVAVGLTLLGTILIGLFPSQLIQLAQQSLAVFPVF